MKILFANLAYFCGRPDDGFRHSGDLYRYLWCSAADIQSNIKSFCNILDQHQPDITGIAEIKSSHLSVITGYTSYSGVSHNKYKQQDKQKNCNACLTKTAYLIQANYLNNGRKRLYYTVDTDKYLIYFVHLALGYRARQQQLRELAQEISKRSKPVIFMGDCNIFNGFQELIPFSKETGLQLLNNQNDQTFQFGQRNHCLDLALVDQSINARLTLIDLAFSDHNGIMIETIPWQSKAI